MWLWLWSTRIRQCLSIDGRPSMGVRRWASADGRRATCVSRALTTVQAERRKPAGEFPRADADGRTQLGRFRWAEDGTQVMAYGGRWGGRPVGR
jgi:hypothetical protein